MIGIEAFNEVLSKAQYIPMNITVKAGDEIKTVDMKKENEMLLQRFGVPYEVGAIVCLISFLISSSFILPNNRMI